MLSAYIDLSTDDRHAIFDVNTGVQLNAAADIVIGPHVWIGMHATILKGVEIGFGSIVGTRSVVTRSVPPMTAVAGIPAKPVRENVSWARPHRMDGESYQRFQRLRVALEEGAGN